MRWGIFIAAGVMAWGAAIAQPSVFKCVRNGVTVFSSTPCGASAEQVDTSRALKRGDSPHVQGVSDLAALGGIDLDCRARRREIGDRYAAEYRVIDADVARLRREMGQSMNNYAGATRDVGIRQQISAAEARRSDAAQAERAEHSELQRNCEKRLEDERRRQADRDAAGAAPVPH